MNIILPTAIVFTVALVHGGQGMFFDGNNMTIYMAHPPYNIRPCVVKSNIGAYNNFVHRHILQKSFNRRCRKAWQRYLVKTGLCGRVRKQSFIDANVWNVGQICRGAGQRVKGATGNKGNLCISNSRLQVYDVVSVNRKRCCRVKKIIPRRQNVIVACNNVANICRPVHYERYRNQRPSNIPCVSHA